MTQDPVLLKMHEKAKNLSSYYKRKRESLTLPNLITVMLPAFLSTIVAIVSGIEIYQNIKVYGIPISSLLSGLSAILITVHKT